MLEALTFPESYNELVAIHHWSADGYETWLAKTFKRQRLLFER